MLRGTAVAITTILATAAFGATGAFATGYYPAWTISPSDSKAREFEGNIDFNLRSFPNATWTSVKTAADGESVRLVNSGSDCRASDSNCEWMTAQTPYGSVFGASGPSDAIRFLTQRAGKTTSITTVYTFSRPAPANALGIALGDIDVDSVDVRAQDASGNVIPLAALVPGAFNFCDVSSDRPNSCRPAPYVVPTWEPSSSGGSGKLVATGTETAGSLGWLRPTTGIKTLTLTFTPNASGAGTPSYRTWFTALGHKVTGQVTTTSGKDVPDALISLYGPDGELLDTVRTDSNGRYDFPDFAAQPGYEVRMSPPEGYYPASPTEENADLSSRDQVVNFKLTTKDPGPGPNPGPKPDVDPEPIPGPAGTITLNYQDVTRENAYTNVDVPSAGTTTQTVSRKVGRRYVRVCSTTRPSTAAEANILVSCRLSLAARRSLRCKAQRFRVQVDFRLATGETTTERRTYVVAGGTCRKSKTPSYAG